MVAAACLAPMAGARTAWTVSGIHKIRHVVIIMQENRSFDSYFGTYPGADGIPGLTGHRGKVPCVPDPARHDCQNPYHNHADSNAGGPHMAVDAAADINGGKMNGFIASVESGHPDTGRLACNEPITTTTKLVQELDGPPTCLDVMGYHDAREVPDTGMTPATSSCRTTCSSQWHRGACPRTSRWCPAGRPRART